MRIYLTCQNCALYQTLLAKECRYVAAPAIIRFNFVLQRMYSIASKCSQRAYLRRICSVHSTQVNSNDFASDTCDLQLLLRLNKYRPCSDKLDVEDHYVAWRQAHDDPRHSAGTEGPFSFCSYPFLLNPRAKSKLLHVEARFTMSQVCSLHLSGRFRVPLDQTWSSCNSICIRSRAGG